MGLKEAQVQAKELKPLNAGTAAKWDTEPQIAGRKQPETRQ